MNDGKDIKSYIETMESKNIPNIYIYSAFKENCQHFVRSILNANGITKYDSFISQDTEVLAPSILQKVAKGITGLAAKIDVVQRGGRYPETMYGGSFLTGLFTPDVSLEDDANRFANFYGKAWDLV
jgi:hypothetical protein